MWPENIFSATQEDGTSILDKIYLAEDSLVETPYGLLINATLFSDGEISVGIPGGMGPRLVIGGGIERFTRIMLELLIGPEPYLKIDRLRFGLRFPPQLLKPAPKPDGSTPRQYSEVYMESSLLIDGEFNLHILESSGLNLEKSFILGSEIAIEAQDLKLDFSRDSSPPEVIEAGFGDDFLGIFIGKLEIYFTGDDLSFIPPISAENFIIGTGGISGKITATFDLNYNPTQKKFEGDAAGELFGAAIGLRKFEVELRANEVVSSEITGQMLLPFFEKPVEIELSLDLKGNISIGLKGTDGAALAELTKDDLLSMKLNSFNFHHLKGQETAFVLGGSIKPLFGDIKWPEIGVNALKIVRSSDGDWDVKVDGGWIELPKKLSFDVYGFKGELSKIGFGSEDDMFRFLGFSGAISFVSSFAIAAGFDDLKIIYPKKVDKNFYKNIRLELKRAALGFAIPGAVSLIGEVSMKEHGFGGMIDVSIIPTQMRIMGAAEFGKYPEPEDFTYMQIFLELELPPPGIVLGSSPASIMGFKGKWAMNMVPSMEPGWTWAITPPRGVTPFPKMVPGKHGKMLGAGIKISTTDGYIMVIDALFALLVPGPVVMIEGKGGVLADLQKYIPAGASGVMGQSVLTEPPFYALVVINGDEQYFSANLAVEGNLIKDILGASGTADVFFDFQRPSNWWIKLGQREPKDKRIQVVYIALKGQGYLEMGAGPHIEAGGLYGFDVRKDFKVGYAVLKAYIEGGAGVSWKPEHLEGWLHMVADIGVKVCGFGLGLGASAGIKAMAPYPRFLEILAKYHYFFNMPWPLPDIEGSGEFKHTWKSGERFPVEEFEPLIAEVTVDSEAPGIPLQTLDSYEREKPENLSKVPVVTLDARPTISFRYPVNDDTDLPLAGNTSNGRILHAVGDARYDFSLKSLKIERFEIGDDLDELLDKWKDPKKWEEVPLSFGVWLAGATTTGKEAATHLRLWSKTPFTQFRQRRYPASILAQTVLAQQINGSSWLNSDPTNGCEEINLGNITANQLNTIPSDGASYLSALIEEESPGYPLGAPQSEWERVGFTQVPLQSQIERLDAPRGIEIIAAHEDDEGLRPFDVVDIPFYIPEDENEPYHKVKEMVRGIYFQGSIEVIFPFPVSNCELYLYSIPRGEKDEYTVYPPPVVFEALKYKYPPKIEVRGWEKSGDGDQQKVIDHIDVREVTEGFYTINISRTDVPIGSVTVDSSDKSLFLVAIGYRVDVQDAYDDGKDKIIEFNYRAWEKEAGDEEPESEGILKPNCCYRLTVGYNAGQELKSKQFYFRTDGPPADYIANYIAWTIPEGNEYPLFREYPIGIHFNSNYIDRCFENTPLELKLQSSGGKSISISGDDLKWRRLQKHRFSPEEQTYMDAVNNSGVDDIDPDNVYPDVTLVCKDACKLEPDETYQAKLGLTKDSNFKKLELGLKGQKRLFTQIHSSFATNTKKNREVLGNSDIPILGSGLSMNKEAKISKYQDLYHFTFRTSKYGSFKDMIAGPDKNGPNIKAFPPSANPDYGKLLDAVNACHETWAPKKAAIWEIKRLMKYRLAKEEDLLKAQDELAKASKDLDCAFDQAIAQLDSDMNMISVQALPQKTTLYYSSHGLLLEFNEPIEFARLEISIDNMSIFTACTSAETRILIIPAIMGESIDPRVTLKITYKLDLGNDKPRYYIRNILNTRDYGEVSLQ